MVIPPRGVVLAAVVIIILLVSLICCRKEGSPPKSTSSPVPLRLANILDEKYKKIQAFFNTLGISVAISSIKSSVHVIVA
jgi:hypothetical protein